MKHRAQQSSSYYIRRGGVEEYWSVGNAFPLLHYSVIPCRKSSSPHPFSPQTSHAWLTKFTKSRRPALIGSIATSWTAISWTTFLSVQPLSVSFANKPSCQSTCI